MVLFGDGYSIDISTTMIHKLGHTLMFTVPCAAHLAYARWEAAYKI